MNIQLGILYIISLDERTEMEIIYNNIPPRIILSRTDTKTIEYV